MKPKTKYFINIDWLKWVIYNLLAVLIGLIFVRVFQDLLNYLTSQYQDSQDYVFISILRPVILGIVFSVTTGYLQWLILKPIIKNLGRWLLFSSFGLGLGFLTFLIIACIFSNLLSGNNQGFLIAGIIIGSVINGALVGWFQSRAFRSHIIGAKEWIRTHAVASFFSFIPAFEITRPSTFLTPILPESASFFLTIGFANGFNAFITGLLIHWLLSQSDGEKVD